MKNEKVQILRAENQKLLYRGQGVYLSFMNYNLEVEDAINMITLHISISQYILHLRLLDTLCHWLA